MKGASPFSVVLDPGPRGTGDWRMSCKEMFDVAGHPADCGHPSYAAFRGDHPTSAVVTRLQRAGARLVGKTLQSELAMSGTGENPHYRMPANPLDPALVTGGSSVGCAVAVATGAVDVAVATDSAGSARIPAACCGVLGVALADQGELLEGAVRLSSTLDQLGLLAEHAHHLSRAFSALGLNTEAPAPTSVLVPWGLVATHCSPAVQRGFRRVVERLQDDGLVVATAPSDSFHEVECLQHLHGTLVLAEMAASLSGFLERHGHLVSGSIVERLRPYLTQPVSWRQDLAQLVLTPLRRFREHEQAPLLLPTLPTPVPRLGAAANLGSLTKFANLLGESSIAIPEPGSGFSVTLVAADPATLLGFARLVTGGPRTGEESP